MPPTFDAAIASFGATAKEKLSNAGATGQPEDQLRAPFERLLSDLAALAGVLAVSPVGESSLSDLKTRPDYAVGFAGTDRTGPWHRRTWRQRSER